jgi:hypothetical protein
MKPYHYVCLLALPFGIWAQGTPEAPVVAEAGPHSRVLQWTTTELDEAGNPVTSSHSVTELATGLNWRNPNTDQWEPSVEAFEITPAGYAVALRGQHRLILAPNINQGASVDLELPDGQQLRSNPMGLSFFDAASGKSVLLAEVKDCVGELIEPNTILFADAFDTLKAALRYTYTRSGFEQDVILYEDPGSPADYGLDPATTHLEMMTEFFNPPAPRKIREPLQDHLEDERLEFGSMSIGRGFAYVLGQNLDSVEVGKVWAQLEGRDFLVETVPYGKVQDFLRAAGVARRAPSASATAVAGVRPAARGREGLVRAMASKEKREGRGMLVAGVRPRGTLPQTGVVLDYQQTLTAPPTGNLFQSDFTYYVSGAFDISGTATFEAGTVIKYASGQYIRCTGPVVFKGDAYRPVIFTAKDDNSVGEIISGSTGSPSGYYANPALEFRSGGTVAKNLRVAYAQVGLFYYDYSAGNANVVSHAQFVQCGTALKFNGYGSTPQNYNVRNVLMHSVGTAFHGYSFNGTVEHLTVDTCTTLADTTSTSYNRTILFRNGVFANVSGTSANVTLSGSGNGFYASSLSFDSAPKTTSTNPFQSVGAGAHYLAAIAASFRNAGTTGIDGTLAADLKKLTTEAPVIVTTMPAYPLAPRVVRDADTPDLGYHYAPLDYLCSQISPGIATVTITLTNGVALGLYGSYGFSLVENNTFISEGAPGAMNRIVWYPSVQEQPVRLNGVATGASGMFNVNGATSTTTTYTKPILRLRFTDLAGLGRRQTFFNPTAYYYGLNTVSLTDCWLRGVDFTVGGYNWTVTGFPIPVATLQNNLVERGTVNLFNGYFSGAYQCPLAANLYNDLFWNSSLTLTYNDTSATTHPNWYVKDNLFDNATISFTGTGSYQTYVSRSNNRFYQTPTGTQLESSPVNLTALTYTTGAFGPWYIASSTPTLVDQGSRLATLASLYHYTLFTGTAKELATTVDAGFHYVSVNSSGQAQDTDGDGLPDYLEDRDGDNVVDSGETNWQQSENGTTGVPGLLVFTYLE